MGTYTTNYNLFMPSLGEQGWGTLVNGNFTTIDTTMAGLNTRLTAVESEVNGALNCTSVTTSGTITSTGLITANGGIEGNVTGLLFVKAYLVAGSGDAIYAKVNAISTSKTLDIYTDSFNCAIPNYNIEYSLPHKHIPGVYTREEDLIIPDTFELTNTRNVKVLNGTYSGSPVVRVTYVNANGTSVSENLGNGSSKTYTVKLGTTMTVSKASVSSGSTVTITSPELILYSIQYLTP